MVGLLSALGRRLRFRWLDVEPTNRTGFPERISASLSSLSLSNSPKFLFDFNGVPHPVKPVHLSLPAMAESQLRWEG